MWRRWCIVKLFASIHGIGTKCIPRGMCGRKDYTKYKGSIHNNKRCISDYPAEKQDGCTLVCFAVYTTLQQAPLSFPLDYVSRRCLPFSCRTPIPSIVCMFQVGQEGRSRVIPNSGFFLITLEQSLIMALICQT